MQYPLKALSVYLHDNNLLKLDQDTYVDGKTKAQTDDYFLHIVFLVLFVDKQATGGRFDNNLYTISFLKILRKCEYSTLNTKP